MYMGFTIIRHLVGQYRDTSLVSSTPPTLLAWCSWENNEISVVDLDTKQKYVNFDGARIINTDYNRSKYVKEIPDTKLLVSLNHSHQNSASMEIFDISKKGKANKIYSIGEVSEMVGIGDVAYNSRRAILAAIPVSERIAYQLFTIDSSASNTKETVKLTKKTKWSSQLSRQDIFAGMRIDDITGFDFNPAGDSIATITDHGVCLISDVNTNNYVFHIKFGEDDPNGRCRWSPNTGKSLLFVKCNQNELDILDAEKKVLTLKKMVKLDKYVFKSPFDKNTREKFEENPKINSTYCIDVCQSNGNLLASGGEDKIIKIFDKRESKIVKKFAGIHTDYINCVRWNQNGDMIASASCDGTAKLLDFKTGQVLHTGTTSDESAPLSVCFI